MNKYTSSSATSTTSTTTRLSYKSPEFVPRTKHSGSHSSHSHPLVSIQTPPSPKFHVGTLEMPDIIPLADEGDGRQKDEGWKQVSHEIEGRGSLFLQTDSDSSLGVSQHFSGETDGKLPHFSKEKKIGKIIHTPHIYRSIVPSKLSVTRSSEGSPKASSGYRGVGREPRPSYGIAAYNPSSGRWLVARPKTSNPMLTIFDPSASPLQFTTMFFSGLSAFEKGMLEPVLASPTFQAINTLYKFIFLRDGDPGFILSLQSQFTPQVYKMCKDTEPRDEVEWTWPKGHPKRAIGHPPKRETPLEAAKREFGEETGTQITNDVAVLFPDCIMEKVWGFNGKIYTIYCWVAIFPKAVHNSEVGSSQNEIDVTEWKTYEDAVKHLPTTASGESILDQARAIVGKFCPLLCEIPSPSLLPSSTSRNISPSTSSSSLMSIDSSPSGSYSASVHSDTDDESEKDVVTYKGLKSSMPTCREEKVKTLSLRGRRDSDPGDFPRHNLSSQPVRPFSLSRGSSPEIRSLKYSLSGVSPPPLSLGIHIDRG